MQKTYELWLDESGKFCQEEEQQQSNRSHSLVGGILIEKNQIQKINSGDYPDIDKAHASKWIDAKDEKGNTIKGKAFNDIKVPYLLGKLKNLKEKTSCRLVFFENIKYDTSYSSIYLYLRMLIQGVFLMYLDLCDHNSEPPILKVIYGKKKDEDHDYQLKTQDYEEYKKKLLSEKSDLKRFIKHKQYLINNILWECGDANPTSGSLKEDMNLWFADHACNTRFNRRYWTKQLAYTKQNVYETVKLAYEYLYNDVIVKSLDEDDYVQDIRIQVELNRIAEAIMNLCSMCDEDILFENEKDLAKSLIVNAMQKSCYRVNKATIKNLCSLCDNLEASTSNFLRCKDRLEQLLCIINNLMNLAIDAPFDLIIFKLHTLIADCYLRSGLNDNANIELKECEKYLKKPGIQKETIFQYYEKQSLTYIDLFDYKRALSAIQNAETLFNRSSSNNIVGEYYGDAVCMHILALMPCLRIFPKTKNKRLKKLTEFSDIGLKQYISYEGELERHRQYRSFIESEKNNIPEALTWLLQAKCGSKLNIDFSELSISLSGFLEKLVFNEPDSSVQWYILYYILIMERAIRINSKESRYIAEQMFQMLVEKKILSKYIGVTFESDISYYALNEKGITDDHPIATIYWKLAYCLSQIDSIKYKSLIHNLYKSKAIEVCAKKTIIRWISIEADRQFYEKKLCKTDISKSFNSLIETINSLSNDIDIVCVMKDIASGLDKLQVLNKLSELVPY